MIEIYDVDEQQIQYIHHFLEIGQQKHDLDLVIHLVIIKEN